jgi:hypothetical protein
VREEAKVVGAWHDNRNCWPRQPRMRHVRRPVHEAAVVHVNGKRDGSVWSAPYEVNTPCCSTTAKARSAWRSANIDVNVLAKGPLSDYKCVNARYDERCQAQDMHAG